MLRELHRPAELLYEILNRRGKMATQQVRSDMEHLYPGQDQEILRKNYYVKKMEKMFGVFAGGVLLTVFLTVRSIRGQPLERENMLRRGGILEEGQELLLEGVYDGKAQEFSLHMEPRQIPQEELGEWYERFSQALPELIMGQNISLQEVRTKLQLSDRYEGYPFEVEWRSYAPDIITSAGEIMLQDQEERVMLKAEISYGAHEWENVLWVTVLEKEYLPEEYQYCKVQQLLEEAELNSREEEYWELPAMVGEQKIMWQNPTKHRGYFLFLVSIGIGAAVYFMSDRDLHREVEKQRELMKQEYPDIVHKLALYLGAGMTLQGAIQKMGAEYEQQRMDGKEQSPGYEQILYTCRELKTGVSESVAYERLGRRTGLQEYIRLCTLMTQNLKKGNASLLHRLHEEAEKALVERIQMSRRLGEEASTKLLVPMVMMLGVVMVMVMLPAFLSMGI